MIRDGKQVFRLFCHESMRVFHDRLINNEDKKYFHTMLAEMASKHFGEVSVLICSVIIKISSMKTLRSTFTLCKLMDSKLF